MFKPNRTFNVELVSTITSISPRNHEHNQRNCRWSKTSIVATFFFHIFCAKICFININISNDNRSNINDRITIFIGNEPSKIGHYHPFYITDSAEGGFGQKSDVEQKKQRVFAGIVTDSEGYPFPTTGIIALIIIIYGHVFIGITKIGWSFCILMTS